MKNQTKCFRIFGHCRCDDGKGAVQTHLADAVTNALRQVLRKQKKKDKSASRCLYDERGLFLSLTNPPQETELWWHLGYGNLVDFDFTAIALAEPCSMHEGIVRLKSVLPARHLAVFLQDLDTDCRWDLDFWEAYTSNNLLPESFRPGFVYLRRVPGTPTQTVLQAPVPGAPAPLPALFDRPESDDNDDSSSSSSTDSGSAGEDSRGDGGGAPKQQKHRRRHRGVHLDKEARALHRAAIVAAARGWRVADETDSDPENVAVVVPEDVEAEQPSPAPADVAVAPPDAVAADLDPYATPPASPARVDAEPPLPPPAEQPLPPPADTADYPPPPDAPEVAPRRHREPAVLPRAVAGERASDWGPFKIARVMSEGRQVGWGCTCRRHQNCADEQKDVCKKQVTYGKRLAWSDVQCIKLLKQWVLFGFTVDSEADDARTQHVRGGEIKLFDPEADDDELDRRLDRCLVV